MKLSGKVKERLDTYAISSVKLLEILTDTLMQININVCSLKSR